MNDIAFTFEDCAKVEHKIFFFTKEANLLCELDLTTGQTTILGSIPEEDFLTNRLVSSILYMDGKLILSPNMAKDIWIFDIKTFVWKKIVREKRNCINGRGSMYKMLQYKNKVYFIGTYYPAIVVLDFDSYQLEYADEAYIRLEKAALEAKDCYFFSNYVNQGEYLYLASCSTNHIVKFNMDTYECQFIAVGDNKNRYANIVQGGGKYWISSRKDGLILQWDGENIIEEIHTGQRWIINSVYFDEQLYVITFPAKDGLIIKNKKEHIADEFMLFCKVLDAGSIIYMTEDATIHLSESGKTYKAKIDHEIITKHIENNHVKINTDVIIEESKLYNLSDFLNAMNE